MSARQRSRAARCAHPACPECNGRCAAAARHNTWDCRGARGSSRRSGDGGGEEQAAGAGLARCEHRVKHAAQPPHVGGNRAAAEATRAAAAGGAHRRSWSRLCCSMEMALEMGSLMLITAEERGGQTNRCRAYGQRFLEGRWCMVNAAEERGGQTQARLVERRGGVLSPARTRGNVQQELTQFHPRHQLSQLRRKPLPCLRHRGSTAAAAARVSRVSQPRGRAFKCPALPPPRPAPAAAALRQL
jgi:hypothetical protein